MPINQASGMDPEDLGQALTLLPGIFWDSREQSYEPLLHEDKIDLLSTSSIQCVTKCKPVRIALGTSVPSPLNFLAAL